jgi:hypothetical protein
MRRFAALLAIALLAGCASSEPDPISYREYDPGERPWQDREVILPAYPSPSNLIEFRVAPTATLKYFVDADSISVGEDRVVRYTLVIRSPQGAENISYEGILCGRVLHKLYATGNRDGTWTKARDTRWERITRDRQSIQHMVLYDDFFCPGRKTSVKDAAEAVAALKRGYHPDSLEAYQRSSGGSGK